MLIHDTRSTQEPLQDIMPTSDRELAPSTSLNLAVVELNLGFSAATTAYPTTMTTTTTTTTTTVVTMTMLE